MPKVSILIATFNCAKYITKAINSVLEQTYTDYEIIIVDDGSTDGTKFIIKTYLDKKPEKIQYYYQKNQGLACARNKALRYSKGKYIALLDADDEWLPRRLEIGVAILDSEADIGLVHSNDIKIDEKGNLLKGYTKRKKYLSNSIAKNLLLRKIHIECATVLFRRRCLDKVGLFDPNLTYLGAEDRDLWFRISKEFNVKYVDKKLAYYRVRKDSLSTNTNNMIKARYYIVNKYYHSNSKNKFLRKRMLGAIHLEIADSLYWFPKKFDRAIKEYLKAIKIFPLCFTYYWHLSKTIFKYVISELNIYHYKRRNLP